MSFNCIIINRLSVIIFYIHICSIPQQQIKGFLLPRSVIRIRKLDRHKRKHTCLPIFIFIVNVIFPFIQQVLYQFKILMNDCYV